MSQDEYIAAIADMLSGEPTRVRSANRRLFTAAVQSARISSSVIQTHQAADVALAQAAGRE